MSHLLLVASGQYASNLSRLQNEGWSCSLRIVLNDGSIDDVADLPEWVPGAADETYSASEVSGAGNFNVVSGPSTFSPIDYLTDDALPAWTTLLNDVTGLSDDCYLRRLALYPIGSDGRTMDVDGTPGVLAKCQLDLTQAADVNGSSSSDMLPTDVATCLSWVTKRTNAHGRGRIYLPAITNGAMGTTTNQGTYNSTYVNAVLAAGLAFIDDLEGSQVSGSWEWKPAVIGSPWDSYAAITEVRVGVNPDTQRRRSRQVSEEYVSDVVTFS